MSTFSFSALYQKQQRYVLWAIIGVTALGLQGCGGDALASFLGSAAVSAVSPNASGVLSSMTEDTQDKKPRNPMQISPYPQSLDVEIGQPEARPAPSEIEELTKNMPKSTPKHITLTQGGPLGSPLISKTVPQDSSPSESENLSANVVSGHEQSSNSASSLCDDALNQQAVSFAKSAKGISDVLRWYQNYKGCVSGSSDPMLSFVPEQFALGWSTQEVRLLNVDSGFATFVIDTLGASNDKGPMAALSLSIKNKGCGLLKQTICQQVKEIIQEKMN